jgi:hypothetical protein
MDEGLAVRSHAGIQEVGESPLADALNFPLMSGRARWLADTIEVKGTGNDRCLTSGPLACAPARRGSMINRLIAAVCVAVQTTHAGPA